MDAQIRKSYSNMNYMINPLLYDWGSVNYAITNSEIL